MNIEKDEDVLDLFSRLLERVQQAGQNQQGCHIELVYVASGGQHIGKIENQNINHGAKIVSGFSPLNEGNQGVEELVARLTPMFYGIEETARAFVRSIQGAKPVQITDMVNQLTREKKISELSKRRDLWQALHDVGLYTKSESNWNQQME